MLSRPERRLLLAESTVEIAADCNVAGVASELAAVVDVIDDGFEPDLGNGSFPGQVTGKHSGYCILSSEMPPTRSKCLAKRSIKVNSRLPNSLAGTGKVYTQEGRPEEAVSYFQRPVDIQPDSAKIHFQLGQAYLKMGQLTKAQGEIAEAGRLQAQVRKKLEQDVGGRAPAPQIRGEQP